MWNNYQLTSAYLVSDELKIINNVSFLTDLSIQSALPFVRNDANQSWERFNLPSSSVYGPKPQLVPDSSD